MAADQSSVVSGRIAFLPWVRVPRPVIVGGFRFVPVRTDDLEPVVASEIAETVAKAIRTHVDQRGKPIEACTLVLRRRGLSTWSIPERLWKAAQRAAETLALSCLSEQRFFEEPFHPHLNATMFRVIGQGIRAGDDGISLNYRRRGSFLQVGGYKLTDVVFQQPPQIQNTACEVVNTRLARALRRARWSHPLTWGSIVTSLELFLLAHAEAPDLLSDTCAMVSAMAFEQLVNPEGKGGAKVMAKAFADLWAPYAGKTISQAERIRADPKYESKQQSWPIHQKWMKELYEVRNAKAHRGVRDGFSTNWTEPQHVVIAALVYPLVVKLKLSTSGLYRLSEGEEAACSALDALLEGGWNLDELGRPEWPTILSDHLATRSMERVVHAAMQKAGSKHGWPWDAPEDGGCM